MADAYRDETIRSFLDGLRLLGEHNPAGWTEWPPHGFAGVTGAPLPTMNGVIAASPELDPQVATRLLERTRESGVPYSLAFPDRAGDALAAVASSHGLTRTDNVPLFRLDDLGAVASNPRVDVRQLEDEEASRHAVLAAQVFGAPVDVFDFVLRPSYVAEPGVRFYLASVDGVAVGSGMGVTHGGATAVFNIVTVDAARGRGVGAAVTHRIVSDGRADGATFAWLQSSPLAVPLYERLGFRRVDDWQVWVSS